VNGRLEGKTCLLMGGGSASSQGMVSNGQAVGLTFAREGARVAVVDMNLAAAEETVARIRAAGGEAFAQHADVTRHGDVRSAVERTHRQFGKIDILYNNVGIETRGGVVETTEEDWDRVYDVNLKSVFLACKEVVPLMESQGAGCVINVSSTASLRWGPVEYLSYSSSKAGINHMTRVMARDFAPKKIRFNAILPGMIDSPHIRVLFQDKSPEEFATILRERDARCPMGRQGTSWEVANAALFLASDEASYVTGVLLTVDGALSC
jgi:NAD(P)-dependent dehydrogenase (short-subunit alcohol dehydrogenase family)